MKYIGKTATGGRLYHLKSEDGMYEVLVTVSGGSNIHQEADSIADANRFAKELMKVLNASKIRIVDHLSGGRDGRLVTTWERELDSDYEPTGKWRKR